MTVQEIIAREQARVRDAARAVIAQRDADIASYRNPSIPPGLPPGVTHADYFPPLPPPLPGYDQNEVPVGGTLMPSPGAGSEQFLLPPVELGEQFDDWFNVEYDNFRASVPETESSLPEDAGGAPKKARSKKRRKKAVKKAAKPKGKKAKPKAKPKPKARSKKAAPKKTKPVPGADSY